MKRYLHRILTCFTLCALLSGLLAVPASAAAFEDVPESHWASSSIYECVELGFFNGESSTRFGVGHQMTRSAFAVVLCRFFGWETSTPTQTIYSDVPANAWYAGAIEAAYNHGAFTNQRAEFRPSDPITREELAVALVRSLGYSLFSGLGETLEQPFQDVTTNAGYISMAYHLGLVSGTSADTFSPDRHASREQVAVILMRLYHKLHDIQPKTLVIASSPEELEGATVAAIPAIRLISGKPGESLPPEEVSAVRDAARQAGLPTLLYVGGGSHALNSIDSTVKILMAAVEEGEYDGLFLDLSNLTSKNKSSLVKLASKLNTALKDKQFYLMAEAPVQTGKAFSGYNYTALAEHVDQLVLRVSPYDGPSDPIKIAPAAPPEEIYYALASLQEIAAEGKASLLFSVKRSSWFNEKAYPLSDEEYQMLMADKHTVSYRSERYAASYTTATVMDGLDLVIWSLDTEDTEFRLRLASLLGASSICITE